MNLKTFEKLLKFESKFLLFDLESNTDWIMNIQEMRIIQIGYLIFNNKFEILDKWSIYVNQQIKLTDFIKNLTWITQEEVDNWLSFKDSMSEFQNKISICDYYLSFWNYDMKQFYHDCRNNWVDYIFDEWNEWKNSRHFNIKDIIAKKLNIKSKWMEKLAEYLWIELEWKIHNWEDDCLNIFKIIKHVFEK